MYFSILISSCLIIGSLAQTNLVLPGFSTQFFNAANGIFSSHPQYLQAFYPPGYRARNVVTVPAGQQVQLVVDVTNPQTFRLRPYDFAVIFDASDASRVTAPCQTSSYATLGTSGVHYVPIVMANTTSIRSFISRTNSAVVDFCVNAYNSGPDPSMLGFRAFWSSISFGTTPLPASSSTRPASTTARPATVTTTRAPTLAPATVASTKTCGRTPIPPNRVQNVRIVNGINAEQGAWPWACALVQNGFQFCGCTIIDKQWVATAGHCVADTTDANIVRYTQVYYGNNDLRSASKMQIIKVIRNPTYDPQTTNNDIALLKLAAPLTFGASVQPACIPDVSVFASAVQISSKTGRENCITGGWGTLYEGQNSGFGTIGSGSDYLQQSTVEIYPQATCRSMMLQNAGVTITDNMFCAGYDAGTYDSCQGDSGGPLVCQESDGTWSLSGIVSFGIGCARAGLPGIYTNVNAFRTFIANAIALN